MQSGVFYGYVELIDGLINRIKSEYRDPLTVVATGGVASLFEDAARHIDHFDHAIDIVHNLAALFGIGLVDLTSSSSITQINYVACV